MELEREMERGMERIDSDRKKQRGPMSLQEQECGAELIVLMYDILTF